MKTPVSEFANFANYGEPVLGQNAVNTSTNGNPPGAPDQLTDLENTFRLDWNFVNPTPNFWVSTAKADAEGFVSSRNDCCARARSHASSSLAGRTPTRERTT